MIFRMVQKIWTDLFTVLSQCRRLTDGQTDVQTEFSSLDRLYIACNVVKMLTSKSSIWASKLYNLDIISIFSSFVTPFIMLEIAISALRSLYSKTFLQKESVRFCRDRPMLW